MLPTTDEYEVDRSSFDETLAVLVLLVWLGLSELRLPPHDRTDKSTGDSCWPNTGDQLLSVESDELRLSETMSGGGRRCSRRLLTKRTEDADEDAETEAEPLDGGVSRLLLLRLPAALAGVSTQEAGAAEPSQTVDSGDSEPSAAGR